MSNAPDILDRFVVFEGLDGAGTSTQLEMLRDALQQRGTPCFATCEPTDGAIGKLIRAVLRGELEVSGCTLALLFAADRSEHLYGSDGVLAALRTGGSVACDRYLFSSLVYQSTDCSGEYVAAVNARFPLPRWLIFIDTPPEECQRRGGPPRAPGPFRPPPRPRGPPARLPAGNARAPGRCSTACRCNGACANATAK